jgi:hypothetical protein
MSVTMNSEIAEPQGSAWLVRKPATEHDYEKISSPPASQPKITRNVILPSPFQCFRWALFRFPNQDYVCISYAPDRQLLTFLLQRSRCDSCI